MNEVNNLVKNGSIFLPESISSLTKQFDILFYVIYWLSLILFFGLLLFGLFLFSVANEHIQIKKQKNK